jgi:hypothetical protein
VMAPLSSLFVTVRFWSTSSSSKTFFNSSLLSVIFWNKIRSTSKKDSVGFAKAVAIKEIQLFIKHI